MHGNKALPPNKNALVDCVRSRKHSHLVTKNPPTSLSVERVRAQTYHPIHLQSSSFQSIQFIPNHPASNRRDQPPGLEHWRPPGLEHCSPRPRASSMLQPQASRALVCIKYFQIEAKFKIIPPSLSHRRVSELNNSIQILLRRLARASFAKTPHLLPRSVPQIPHCTSSRLQNVWPSRSSWKKT